MIRRHRALIYVSWNHILAVFFFIAAPLIFLLLFAGFTTVTLVDLMTDFSTSVLRLGMAYVIAVVLAWILALVFSTGKRSHIALPIFDVLQGFPMFAIVPVVILTFGANNLTVIFFLVITIIWPILFSTVNALKLIKAEYFEVADIYGLHGWNRLRYLLIPASISGIVTGSIVGLGDGWGALVATEIIMKIDLGLGNFFERNSGEALVTGLGIIALMLIIFTINRLIWTPIQIKVYQRLQE